METKNNIKIIFFLSTLSLSLYFLFSSFQKMIGVNDAKMFTVALFELIKNLLLYIIFFYALFFKIIKPKQNKKNPLNFIFLSIILSFLFLISINFVVNPRGIYSSSIFPTLETNMRIKKVNDYNNYEKTPELVIIGSSRSLSLNPDYIEKATGLRAYNFGVTGTYLDEQLVILRYILEHDPINPPNVLLIERSGFTINPEMTAVRAPLQFFPYIDNEYRTRILTNRLSELINIHQLTESLYVLQFFIFNNNYTPTWTVDDNGFASLFSEKTLEQAVDEAVAARVDRKPCDTHQPEVSVPIIDEMVSIAAEYNSNIVFFTTPSQPNYFEELNKQKESQTSSDENPPTCGQEVRDYYLNLLESNDHISLVYLSSLDDFNGFSDERGFHDNSHMTETNSNLLIEALTESMIKAYQDSILQRNILISP